MLVTGLAVCLAGLVGSPPGAAGAAGAPYRPTQDIPGTAGQFNHVSATAPDGTDVVVWIAGTSGDYRLDARLRLPGHRNWKAVAAGVQHRVSIQDIVISPVGAGDFQLAWVEYGAPEVFTSRLASRTGRWSAPRQVFSDPAYHHSQPAIAASADGSVVIAADAPAVTSSSPPVYRVVVGVQRGDGTFTHRYLSAPDEFAIFPTVALSPAGQAVVGFVTGYDTADKTLVVATRGAGSAAPWRVAPVSAAGDAQRLSVSINRRGRAAVAWTAPAATATAVRVATADVGAGPTTWTTSDAVTASHTADPHVVVPPDGDVTAVWRYALGTTGVVTARHLGADGADGPVTPLSDPAYLASFADVSGTVVGRPDGRVAVLYGLYSTSPSIAVQGQRLVVLNDGAPGTTVDLTDAGEPNQNQYRLGLDAAGNGNVAYARGYPPEEEALAWIGQVAAPSVLTSPTSGTRVTRTTVTRAGRTRLRCDSGFWVEAGSATYSWWRGATRLRGETHLVHHVTAADRHHRLSCRLTLHGQLAAASTRLRSRPRLVP